MDGMGMEWNGGCVVLCCAELDEAVRAVSVEVSNDELARRLRLNLNHIPTSSQHLPMPSASISLCLCKCTL